MARWLVPLSGEPFDLQEYPRSFPDGDVFAVQRHAEVYLTGPAFEACPDAAAVQQEAERMLEQFTAIISLQRPTLKKPIVTEVIREDDDGRRHSTLFVAMPTIPSTFVAFPPALSGSGCSPPPEETTAQAWLSVAARNPHFETALTLWSDTDRSWPRLYRILEEIERGLGEDADKADLCRASERTRFRRTANHPDAGGLDARHAKGNSQPPDNPMTKNEGKEFVQNVLINLLNFRMSRR